MRINSPYNAGIIEKFTADDEAIICIGKISEVIADLSPKDVMRYKSGHSDERAQQLACADLLASTILGKTTQISRDVDGAPFLPLTMSRVSISHTDDYMAMIISERNVVAVDIELVTREVESFGRRFLAPGELELARTTNWTNPALLIWSIKECLFKISPVNGMLFKEHLLIKEIEATEDEVRTKCEVSHEEFQESFSVVSRIFGPLIMSYIDQAA